MFDIAHTVIGGIVALFVVGFVTPKVVFYGGVTTGVMAAGAPVVPGHTSSDVVSLMVPRLLAMGTVFIRALAYARDSMTAKYGLVGLVGVVAVGGVMFVPYSLGMLCGFRYWPELAVLRIVF